MKGKVASITFLGICAVLAVLLIANVATPLVAGVIFAVALVILGSLSGGFHKV